MFLATNAKQGHALSPGRVGGWIQKCADGQLSKASAQTCVAMVKHDVHAQRSGVGLTLTIARARAIERICRVSRPQASKYVFPFSLSAFQIRRSEAEESPAKLNRNSDHRSAFTLAPHLGNSRVPNISEALLHRRGRGS